MDEEQTTESMNEGKPYHIFTRWLAFAFLGVWLTLGLKKKKEKSLISSKRMITTNCKIKEGKRPCPSLSLYRVSKPLLLTTGTPRGSQRTMDRRTHRNLGKRRLYLSLHSGPYNQRLFNFLFFRKHQLFLGFSSLSLFVSRPIPSALPSISASFNFSYLIAFLCLYQQGY